MTFATLLGSLRKGVITTLMSVCPVQAREKQAEGNVPGDCVCTGCPDHPMKCNDGIFFSSCLLDVLLRSPDWPGTGHEMPADVLMCCPFLFWNWEMTAAAFDRGTQG